MADRDLEPLRALQRRFHALIVSGRDGDGDGLLDGPDADGRAGIYRHMYRARLHGVLATDLPKLRLALGADAFAAIADAYLAACPPRSFTLRDLANRLPAFVATRSDVPPWASDLARLEWARADVFDAADTRALTAGDVMASADIAALRLELVAASAVVELGWDVDRVWSELEDGQPAPEVAPSPRTVLVWRRDLRVVHRTLDDDEATAVRRLAAGTTFGALCALLADSPGAESAATRAAELLLRWVDAGALAAQPT